MPSAREIRRSEGLIFATSWRAPSSSACAVLGLPPKLAAGNQSAKGKEVALTILSSVTLRIELSPLLPLSPQRGRSTVPIRFSVLLGSLGSGVIAWLGGTDTCIGRWVVTEKENSDRTEIGVVIPSCWDVLFCGSSGA